MDQPISRVLSWTVIHLGSASPQTSSDLPGSSAGRAIGTLFGLAPGGVYPAIAVTSNAVRSYRTISALPVPSSEEEAIGGIFSAALAVTTSSPMWRPGVTWHPALWSPDFPPVAYATSDCLAGPGGSLAPRAQMSLRFICPLLKKLIDIRALSARPRGKNLRGAGYR